MADGSTHPSLLSRVRDPGNEAAWREFDCTYGPLIIGYCRRLGLQLSDAEDIRQVVLSNLCKALPKFEFQPERGKFRTYLGRIVRNAVSKHLRRHNHPNQALDTTMLAVTPSEKDEESDEQWEQEWVLHHYRLAMAALRSTCDDKSLKIFDELIAGESHRDIAAKFDMTQEAVRKTKQRVKQRLQSIVQRQVTEEDNLDESR